MSYLVQAFPYPFTATSNGGNAPTGVSVTATLGTSTIGTVLGQVPTSATYPGAGTSISAATVNYGLVQEIAVINTDSSAHTVTIWDMPDAATTTVTDGSGHISAQANLVAQISVPAGRSVNVGASTLLGAGRYLRSTIDAAPGANQYVAVRVAGCVLVG